MSSLIIWLILLLFFKTKWLPSPSKQFLPLQVRTLLIQLKTLPSIKTNWRLVGKEVIFCGPLSRSKSFINRAELERMRQKKNSWNLADFWFGNQKKDRGAHFLMFFRVLLDIYFMPHPFLGLHKRRIKFVQHSLRPVSWTKGFYCIWNGEEY